MSEKSRRQHIVWRESHPAFETTRPPEVDESAADTPERSDSHLLIVLVLLAAVVVLIVMLAGCGGSDPELTPDLPTPAVVCKAHPELCK